MTTRWPHSRLNSWHPFPRLAGGAPAARKRGRCFRPFAEALEDRTLPAVFNPLPSAGDGAAGSLRAALVAANGNGEDDTITLSPGLYKLTVANTAGQENASAEGDLDLTEAGHTITLQGAGPDLTLLDANGLDRAFHIFANVTAVFRDLSVTRGGARDDGTAGATPTGTRAQGGGLLNSGGAVTLDNVRVEQNTASGADGDPGAPGRDAWGGGIYSNGGRLTLRNSVVRENTAIGGDGGTGATGGTPGSGGSGGGGRGGGRPRGGGDRTQPPPPRLARHARSA